MLPWKTPRPIRFVVRPCHKTSCDETSVGIAGRRSPEKAPFRPPLSGEAPQPSTPSQAHIQKSLTTKSPSACVADAQRQNRDILYTQLSHTTHLDKLRSPEPKVTGSNPVGDTPEPPPGQSGQPRPRAANRGESIRISLARRPFRRQPHATRRPGGPRRLAADPTIARR
jgi:hypothetical protein